MLCHKHHHYRGIINAQVTLVFTPRSRTAAGVWSRPLHLVLAAKNTKQGQTCDTLPAVRMAIVQCSMMFVSRACGIFDEWFARSIITAADNRKPR